VRNAIWQHAALPRALLALHKTLQSALQRGRMVLVEYPCAGARPVVIWGFARDAGRLLGAIGARIHARSMDCDFWDERERARAVDDRVWGAGRDQDKQNFARRLSCALKFLLARHV